MKDLRGQVVLLTGAAGGFGRALSRRLLAEGCYLILADASAALLRAAAPGLPAAAPGRVLGLAAADLSSPAGCAELLRAARGISPQIDILINNAGVGLYGALHHLPAERWERLMQINLLAPMRLTAGLLPAMIARGSGHLVYVSSVAGLVGVPSLAPYSTAKFGLRGFAEAIALEAQPHGVDVTAIYPFFSRTPILHAERFGAPPPELPAALIYDPAFVMDTLVDGMRQGRRHIYPGALPRLIDGLRRLAPWMLPRLMRADPPLGRSGRRPS